MEISEELINQNKVLDIKTLYNIAKRRLKLPRKGLLNIIQFLLKKKILIQGSKLTKKSVLLNEYRKNIYDYVKTNLGSHFSLIREKVPYGNYDSIGSPGQFAWHIEILLRFNYIKKINYKKYSIIIPIEIDNEIGIYSFLLRDEINKAIVNLLKELNTFKKSDIHKHLTASREIIYYHLKCLINDNILIEDDANNYIYINPDKKDIIIEILNKIHNLRK